MKVIFCTNNLPASLLIRLLTWSKWSHCGVVIGDKVIHSTASKGVHYESLESVKSRYKTEVREILGDELKAHEMIGCKYDWFGLFGHWFGAWNDGKRWFCSELVASCSDVFNRESTSRITPQNCYMVSHSLNSDE